LLHRLEDQRRVGGRVAWRVRAHGVEVAAVGDHRGELPESLECVHACFSRDARACITARTASPASSTNSAALHAAIGTPSSGTFASLHDAVASNSHGKDSSRRSFISVRSAKVNTQDWLFDATNCWCSAAHTPPSAATPARTDETA